MYSIYSLCPAPWGDQYRFVESFDTVDDAKEVLASLEKVNISFNCYKIVEEESVQTNKQLRAENKKLLKDLKAAYAKYIEHMLAVEGSNMYFQRIGEKLVFLKKTEEKNGR